MTFRTFKWFTQVACSLLRLIPKMKKGVKLKNTGDISVYKPFVDEELKFIPLEQMYQFIDRAVAEQRAKWKKQQQVSLPEKGKSGTKVEKNIIHLEKVLKKYHLYLDKYRVLLYNIHRIASINSWEVLLWITNIHYHKMAD